MKFHTEYITVHTKTKRAYVRITSQVEAALEKSGIKDGMILVSAMHITAGVYVNDDESGLIEDIDAWLERLAPFKQDYQHHQTGEDNGDAHLKSLLVHHEVIVPVTKGRLDFGRWQQIFYAEFDGQRDKRILIKVMGEQGAWVILLHRGKSQVRSQKSDCKRETFFPGLNLSQLHESLSGARQYERRTAGTP